MSDLQYRDKTMEAEFHDEMMRLNQYAVERSDYHLRVLVADELVKLRRKVKEYAKPVIIITLEGGLVRTATAKGLPKDAVLIVSDYDAESADPDDDSLDVANSKGDMAHIHQEEILKLDEDFYEPILRKYHLI